MPIDRLHAVPWDALDVGAVLPVIAAALSGAPAERELERLLRAHRGWSREQRQAAAEAVFGVALWRRRLAWAAGISLPSIYSGAPVPHPSPILSRESDIPMILLTSLIDHLAAAPLPPPLRALAPAAGEPTRLADRWSLPDWLELHLQSELGAEAGAFCAAISSPGPIALRANRLRATRSALAEALSDEGISTHEGARAPDALIVDTPHANLFGSRAWRGGLFELQDEGSQLAGLLVEPRPGETVLDLCAGSGGKSLLLAAQGARVLAHDTDPERLTRLRARARRAGADPSIEVVQTPTPADRILVDAPCSELGTLRRGPDLRWRIDGATLRTLPALQRRLLETAAPLAKTRLVYATCTVNRAENEAVAEAFEAGHREFRRSRPFWRTLPHTHDTDGFFAAIWDRA